MEGQYGRADGTMEDDRAANSAQTMFSVAYITHLPQRMWSIARATIALTLLSLLKPFRSSRAGHRPTDVESTDPSLLAKNTVLGPLSTKRFTYPSIRLVYHAHPKAEKLPADLPLLVFVHGLGGSAAQFAPLVTSLSSAASCLLIDLPGCGRSALDPKDEAAYTLPALAEVVAAAIDRFLLPKQKVVLIAHSLGCSISALLASRTSPVKNLLADRHIVGGFVAICPRVEPVPDAQRKQLRRIKYIPTLAFDAFRMLDRRGGLNSGSITRFVGKDADIETRKLQERYNAQSQSATVLKFLGALGQPESDWPSEDVWKGVRVPLFLVTAEGDTVLSPKAIDVVVEWLQAAHNGLGSHSTVDSTSHRASDTAIPAAAGDVETEIERFTSRASDSPSLLKPDDARMASVDHDHETTHHRHAIKTTLFPASAGHGLMYTTTTVRPLASLIQNFLASHVDSRLSPAWQLNHMSTFGKWDVKNLKKWDSVEPISGVIASTFRAMKTMREVDNEHTPKRFVEAYGCWSAEGRFVPDGVGIVIDISHEAPVYDPKGLEEGRIHYYKFPTVSKLPPRSDEVAAFIALINRVKANDENVKQGAKIGVHCHYGFNRTGFFLICYIIEQLAWSVDDALKEFKEQRPPGIKHNYFVDELYLRYGVSLQRRGTMIGLNAMQ